MFSKEISRKRCFSKEINTATVINKQQNTMDFSQVYVAFPLLSYLHS